MGIWIRAVCVKSVAQVTTLQLRNAFKDSDFMAMAESQELQVVEGLDAEKNLRFESIGDDDFDVWLLHYRKDNDHFIRIERWHGEKCAEEIAELQEELGDTKGEAARRVRQVLQEATESVGFELKASDAASMGWPLALEAAMWLAKRGQGLVEAEGGWFDPVSWEPVLEK
jgi:hypothetical protein